MKKNLFFLSFIFFFSLSAQKKTVKGKVLDQKTHNPLPFTHVFIDEYKGITTDENGKFEWEIPVSVNRLNLSYTGYKNKSINLQNNQSYYIIYMVPAPEALQSIEISAKGYNPAPEWIKKAVKRKQENDFRQRKESITYHNYYKFIMTTYRDSLNCDIDTITLYKDGRKKIIIDSTMFDFCQELKNKELYLVENITQSRLKNHKIYRKVLASKTAGFKKPLYELLQLQFSGKNPYDDYYSLMFKEYLGPFSKKSLKDYRYKITDTLTKQGRTLYKISFKKTEKPFISGELLLDAGNLSLAEMRLFSNDQLQINSLWDFTYLPDKKLWFPVLQKTIIRPSKNFTELQVGNFSFKTKIKNTGIDSIFHTNNQTPEDFMYVKIIDSLTSLPQPIHMDTKPFYAIQVDPDASRKNEDFWYQYTRKYLNEREKNTYKVMDSLFEEENIEGQIYRYKKLLYGKWRMGKTDWDLSQLFTINRYEGMRIEGNFTTNTDFSHRWKLGSFLAYGLKDKDLKYHLSAAYKLSHKHQTFLGISYTRDLEKSAVFKDTEEGFFFTASLRHYPWQYFDKYKEIALELNTLAAQNVKISLKAARSFNKTAFNIPFHPGRVEFNEYDLSRIDFTLSWEPNSLYMLDEEGRKKIKNAFPKYLWSIQTDFPNLQSEERHFLRMELQALFRKNYINKNHTDLKLQIGMNMGQVRIEQMFQPDFNDYNGQLIWQHLNLSGQYSFETVKDFEFLNNYIFTAHLSHRFKKIKLSSRKSMDLRLTTAMAYGFAWDENTYTGSRDLRHGLFESGVEFHRVFNALGIGFYYRWGHYAQVGFENNFSLRFHLDLRGLFSR
jgi:hypothetical protein